MNFGAIIILCLIASVAFFLVWREGLLTAKFHFFGTVFLLLFAFAIRAHFMDYETLDYQNFLAKWVDYYRTNGGFRALGESVGNYNLPYLYLLAAFSYLPIRDLYLIKLLSIAFDVLLAYGCMKITGLFTKSKSKRFTAFIGALLLPTVVLNGSVWAQCDSIYVSLAVMSIYHVLSNKPIKSMIFIALSFAFKLQAVFIMPVFLIFLYTNRVKIWHLFIFPVTYFIVVLPAIIAGRPISDTILLYFNQAGSIGNGLNYNSPSVFGLVSNQADPVIYSRAGIIAAFVFLIGIFVWFFATRSKSSNLVMLIVTTLIVVGVPFFLPHMHDRYFFLADIFTFILAIVIPRYIPLAVLTSFASILGYHAYLKMQYLLHGPRPMGYGSVALILVMLVLVSDLAVRLHGSRDGKG